MKLYRVVYEQFYDDFGGGGTSEVNSWLYHSKENAIKKVAEIKPAIYEEYKEHIECGNLIDEPECYSIYDDMGYWGEAVCIREMETED